VSRILAIDTAGPVLGLALWENGVRIAGVENAEGMRHTENLLPHIDRLVTDAGWRTSLDAVAVARGPGSFTGLRIGMATAKAIALAGDLPVVSVGTLDALAETERYHRAVIGAPLPEAVVPVLDARKQRFYAAIFTRVGHDGDAAATLGRVTDDLDIAFPEILAQSERFRDLAVPGPDSDAFMKCANAIPAAAAGLSGAAGVAILGERRATTGHPDGPYAGPVYIRDGDIGAPKQIKPFQGEGDR
jgi:tRNA threonylcarbamoyladenosine biosynthesis protein TsaB